MTTLFGFPVNETDTLKWYINNKALSEIQWIANRPALRKVYRKQGYPFGRNDGAFKRWVLTRPAEFWHELEAEKQ